MPLYEYTCGACGASVQKIQERGAEAPAECPKCGSQGTLERGISKTSFHLKGGGWYVTDYAKSGSASGGGSESASSESSSTESASSSDD